MNDQIDPKTIDRIRKLLALARDGGATEHEANTAMERAEAIMLLNNLSMAEIELSGGAATEARLKEHDKGKANYRWQRWLMAAVAPANYVWCGQLVVKKRNRHGFRDVATGYELIGKTSNIASTRVMYEYLLETCARMRREYEAQPGNTTKEGALFVEGLAYRLSQRITERHEEQLRRQAEEAEAKKKEQAARSSHPGAAPTGNALVVVMTDYANQEADLNEDLRRGYAPGTTAHKRAMREAKDEAEAAHEQQLIASGIEPAIAWLMANLGWTKERAEKYQEANERASQEEPKQRRSRGGGRTREDRLHDRLYTGAAGEGRRAADNVSLDRQIDKRETRRIK